MRKIDRFLTLAVEKKASDLHFSTGEPTRFRIDGDLQIIDESCLENETLSALLFELLKEEEREKLLENRNLDKSFSAPGVGNFRLNIFFNRKGIAAVLRTIPSRVPSTADLGLPPVCTQLCNLEKGLVLVTGPTGSGKSTTLAAMINHINETTKNHILTVEDPVEFVHESKQSLINQREIGSSCYSFADALKYALREDPDVILIGEMRDLETIALALTAAETGHLVFGTLHTRGAAASVDRIIDFFPSTQQAMIRTMLAESLKAVISQALLRRASGSGRVAVHEIMVVNNAISNLIREGKTFQIPSAIQTGKKDGMISMDHSIIELVSNQVVAPEEAIPLMENPSIVESMAKNMPKKKAPVLQKQAEASVKPTEASVTALQPPSSILANSLVPKAVPVANKPAPPTLPSKTPPKIPSKNLVPNPALQKSSSQDIPDEPSLKAEKPGSSTPPLSKISFQESFKSLLEEGEEEELLANWELDPEEKKKVG